MTDNEVNRVIAEYMWADCDAWSYGFVNDDTVVEYDIGLKLVINYTKSLDALVPVWEKLHDSGLAECLDYIGLFNTSEYSEAFFGESWPYESDSKYHLVINDKNGKSIHQAAAYATARAIQEVSDE